MTNWENVVSDKELVFAKNKRKNMYIEDKQRKVALQELEEEGWEYVKDYADSKFVKVRREKPSIAGKFVGQYRNKKYAK